MMRLETNSLFKKHLKMANGYNKSRVYCPAFYIFRIHFFSEAGEPCEAKPGNPKISFCEALANNMGTLRSKTWEPQKTSSCEVLANNLGTRYFSGNPHKNHIFLANFVDYFTFFLSLNIFIFFHISLLY